MGRVTGGEVTYGRTVKTGDFENKRVDVKLSFGVDDSEDHAATLNAAASAAVAKAHDMLGLNMVQNAGQQAKPPITRKTASTTDKNPNVPPASGPLGPEDPITGIPEGLKRAQAQQQAQVQTPADPLDLGDLTAPAAPEPISDKDLVERVTRHNAKIKNPVAIRELVTKYGATSLVSLASDKRHAFLTEMEALPAAGAK